MCLKKKFVHVLPKRKNISSSSLVKNYHLLQLLISLLHVRLLAVPFWMVEKVLRKHKKRLGIKGSLSFPFPPAPLRKFALGFGFFARLFRAPSRLSRKGLLAVYCMYTLRFFQYDSFQPSTQAFSSCPFNLTWCKML